MTITEDLDYYVNDKQISKGMLEAELKSKLIGNEGVVVLHIDKSVPTEHLVDVASVATLLEAKVSIATRPN